MSVIRLLPDDQVVWMLYNRGSRASVPGEHATSEAQRALTEQDFESQNRREFAFSHGNVYASVKEMIEDVLREEVPKIEFRHQG